MDQNRALEKAEEQPAKTPIMCRNLTKTTSRRAHKAGNPTSLKGKEPPCLNTKSSLDYNITISPFPTELFCAFFNHAWLVSCCCCGWVFLLLFSFFHPFSRLYSCRHWFQTGAAHENSVTHLLD